MYTPLSDGEFQLIRQTLLAFFQDMRVRVRFVLWKMLKMLENVHELFCISIQCLKKCFCFSLHISRWLFSVYNDIESRINGNTVSVTQYRKCNTLLTNLVSLCEIRKENLSLFFFFYNLSARNLSKKQTTIENNTKLTEIFFWKEPKLNTQFFSLLFADMK